MRARIVFGTLITSASAYSSIPLAFADDKKSRSIYDDDEDNSIVEAPKPGVSQPTVESKNSELKKLEARLDLKKEQVSNVPVLTSSSLEKNVEKARKVLIQNIDKANDQLNKTFNRYLNAENSITKTIANLKSPDEAILPSAIWILVGTLTGSIVAKRRGIFLRTASPLIFGIASFAYFMPKSFKNTNAFVWKYEQKVPSVASAHLKTLEAVDQAKHSTKHVAEISEQGLTDVIHSVRSSIASWAGIRLPESKDEKSPSDKKN